MLKFSSRYVYPITGIHAREWIAPAVATYFVRELLENSEQNAKYFEGDGRTWIALDGSLTFHAYTVAGKGKSHEYSPIGKVGRSQGLHQVGDRRYPEGGEAPAGEGTQGFDPGCTRTA